MTKTDMMALASKFSLLKEEYEKQARTYINSIAPMGDDEFWSLAPTLLQQVSRLRDSDRGCDEFSRSMIFMGGDEMANWEKVAAFSKTYAKVSANLSRHLFESDLDRGDDSFSDLCDSLPLAGRDVYDLIMAKERWSTSALENTVGAAHRKFICHGENYIRMFLSDNLVKWFHYIAGADARREALIKHDEELEAKWAAENAAKKK